MKRFWTGERNRGGRVRAACLILGVCLAVFPAAGCRSWQHQTTVQGVTFQKVRFERDGLAIGVIERDTVIQGRPCRRGWVQVYSNGVPAAFTSARDISLDRLTIPSGTWVQQNADGVGANLQFSEGHRNPGPFLPRGRGRPERSSSGVLPEWRAPPVFSAAGCGDPGSSLQSGIIEPVDRTARERPIESLRLEWGFCARRPNAPQRKADAL